MFKLVRCIWNGVDRDKTPRIFYIALDTAEEKELWYKVLMEAIMHYKASPEGQEKHSKILEEHLTASFCYKF
jgi:hypothetical protein